MDYFIRAKYIGKNKAKTLFLITPGKIDTTNTTATTTTSVTSTATAAAAAGWLPQWRAADAEIKVPSSENTELERSPFKAWSRLVCSHTRHTYCQGFLPYLLLPFRSIHLHFFQNRS